MSILSDKDIKNLALKKKMIENFEPEQIRDNVISFGLSSYGYDFRLSEEFQIFKGKRLDPKNTKPQEWKKIKTKVLEISPGQTVLGRSIEYFRIPRDIITICYGKSTYARCGILLNVTPFEPEWEGFATLAITNTSKATVKIYAGEGIGQLIFLKAQNICKVSYKDKKGKYQNQKMITPAKL